MSRTLLIADDATIIREMIKEAATHAGWTVVGEAANGAEAIALYEQLRPDAVTMDLVMPQFDGLHALQGIRSLDPRARVMVVSALEQASILKEAFKLGAADFLCKPFDRDRLVETLDRLVSSPN